MPFLSLGSGWGDEFEVSEFALAAYNGDIPKLEKLLAAKPDLTLETMALYLALRAGNKEVFSWLVNNKLVITESFYTYILYYEPDFLELVSPDEEALRLAQCRQVSLQLAEGLRTNKLSIDEVRKLIYAGADCTRGIHIVKGSLDYFPIHLAAIHPNIIIFKEIVRAGGDPKQTSPDGKNSCRMIYESHTLSRPKMKAFVEYFNSTNVYPIPSLTLIQKLRLKFGLPVR